MPEQHFALQRDGEKRLKISWEGRRNNTRIELDGKLIGSIATKKELDQGQDFTLPDKSSLHVQQKNSLLASGLIVNQDNRPLPDSINDPFTTLRNGYQLVYIVAAFNILMGIITTVYEFENLQGYNLGPFAIFTGVVYFVLARFISKKYVLALTAFMIVFSMETILDLFTKSAMDVLIRFFVIYYLSRAYAALKQLKQEKQGQPKAIE